MINILNMLNSFYLLFLIIFFSLALKLFLGYLITLRSLISQGIHQKNCYVLLTIIGSAAIIESVLAVMILYILFPWMIDASTIRILINTAWIILIPHYYAINLFLHLLAQKKFFLRSDQKIICILCCAVILLSIPFIAWDYIYGISHTPQNSLGSLLFGASSILDSLMHYMTGLLLIVLLGPSLYFGFKQLKSATLPKILQQQLTTLLIYVITPSIIMHILIAAHFSSDILSTYSNILVSTIASLNIFIAYYYSSALIKVRFLNFTDHVKSDPKPNFANNFKIILEQLSFATHSNELMLITKLFFKKTFTIAPPKIQFYSIALSPKNTPQHEIGLIAEGFYAHHKAAPAKLVQHKILIYDELVFNTFYVEDPLALTFLQLLEKINAEIFIPIFENNQIIGFIMVERNARPEKLYTHAERDQMLVFANYLNNIIILLQNRNFESLIAHEQELKQELNKKQQEIKLYKENIRIFLKNIKQREIGIIIYSQKRFMYANQIAKEMIKINLNTHADNPLTVSLKEAAYKIEQYQTSQNFVAHDLEGNRFIIAGVSNLDQTQIIFTVSQLNITNTIAQQLEVISDPSRWDYLLSLETTRQGQLINALIPSNAPSLLNFKISLLQIALNQKTIFLEIAPEDLVSMVELLHYISLRDQLQTLILYPEAPTHEIGRTLFGINPIFGKSQSLLEKLDQRGTLYIKNIDHLDLESQEHLLEFIRTGSFRKLKSNQYITSSVQIICSAQQPLQELTQKGRFLPALLEALQKYTLILPTLTDLSESQWDDLAQPRKDKMRTLDIQKLKNKIQHLLKQRITQCTINQDIQSADTSGITDPDLLNAKKMGKHALRDYKMVVTLWNTFKNQNRIALFLGVNRSTVSRRFKEYNLES